MVYQGEGDQRGMERGSLTIGGGGISDEKGNIWDRSYRMECVCFCEFCFVVM